jgi:hypothetical protein
MTDSRATGFRPGDVLELETSAGLAYLQVTHWDPIRTWLVRVLPGVHPERPPDLRDLVGGPERFIAFYPAEDAVRQRLVHSIGNFPLPKNGRKFPKMLLEGVADRDGRIMGWWTYDGKQEQLVDKGRLDKYRHLPVGRLLMHQGLINAVLSEQRPDRFSETSPFFRRPSRKTE